MVETFKKIIDLNPAGKLVVISVQCGSLFKRSLTDRRLFDSYRVLMVDSHDNIEKGSLEFVSSKLSANIESGSNGLDHIDKAFECGGDNHLIVRTCHQKAEYPQSLIDIHEVACSYDLLARECSDLSHIAKSAGTEKQWNYLYTQINLNQNFEQYVKNNFGGSDSLKQCLKSFHEYDSNKRWGLLLALKVYGASGSDYLSEVINKSEGLEDFCDQLYMLILEKDHKSKDFLHLYEERKPLLQAVNKDIEVVSEFCKRVSEKGSDALYYLTDSSVQEQEQIVKTIAEYAGDYDKIKLLNILQLISPKLASYLQPYDYKQSWLSTYFNEYKFCKVTNRISKELREIVEEQAKKRDYNNLPHRATFVDNLEIDKHCAAYFVDALGVEYLGYIQSLCYNNGLLMKANIGRCNLPSVTEFNKEFIDAFISKGISVTDVDLLDRMIHSGVVDNNYDHLKEPIHISSQLQILDNLISKVKERLYDGNTDRVFLISDHGASRMVIINDNETKCSVIALNKGEHSGRCCRASELDGKPQNAAEDNGYWCLANYDRFKGGKLSGVELHGGATLEEVCIPIITITRKDENINCYILDKSKTIVVSFKRKAQITLYISKELDNVSIRVGNGEIHTPSNIEHQYFYVFDLPEIKRAGTYKVNVYSGDSIIATGLTFAVKKEGASERKFF